MRLRRLKRPTTRRSIWDWLLRKSRLLPMLLLPVLGGCGLLEKETPLPETTKLLDNLPTVENSPRSPCWQQKQIAAQRSYLESARTKKETVYVAPCVIDKQPAQQVATAKGTGQ